MSENGSFSTWSSINEPRYAKKLQPELVSPSAVLAPAAYKRFRDTEIKDAFRIRLLGSLKQMIAESSLNIDHHSMLEKELDTLLGVIDRHGALMLEGVVDSVQFGKLVERYDRMMGSEGNGTFLHNFVDVRSHSEILLDDDVNESFLHPLFIALVAMRVGGPVRLVDVRAKDAEPISVLAQDNMLHIDNTPFNDEYKVLLTWERGTTKGPNGQNFTYLPGTHKLARQCQVDDSGVWSSENCSIFTTEESVEKVLEAQQAVLESGSPRIIEVTGSELPVSTVFPAGSLVHHRYRTSAGQSRSCIIAAFHRVQDNPGTLISLGDDFESELTTLLAGRSTVDEDLFISALSGGAGRIVSLLDRIHTRKTIELGSAQVSMPDERFPDWFRAVTTAPLVSDLRARGVRNVNRSVDADAFKSALVERLMFDKHGPIDLVLYADNHEEVRKWARNSLRELNANDVEMVVSRKLAAVGTITPDDIQTPDSVSTELIWLADVLDSTASGDMSLADLGHLRTARFVGMRTVHDSLSQFARDLAQAIKRTDGRDSFRSTSLFAFMVADAIERVLGSDELAHPVEMLWRNYCVLALAD